MERLLIGVAVASGLAAVAIALIEKPDAGDCRPTHTRLTELPLAVGGAIVFVTTAIVLVGRNRDVYNKRRGMGHQLGPVFVAAMLALGYFAVAQLFLENWVCD